MTKANKQVNLVFLRRGDEILLAMKKRRFGAGRWNGVGGKVEPGETVLESAIRETHEEIGVKAKNLAEVGVLRFFYAQEAGEPAAGSICTVYTCEEWQGEPVETEEMAPQWFNVREIPYEGMWPDDKFWLPEVLAGRYVEADFVFGKGDEILDMKVAVTKG